MINNTKSYSETSELNSRQQVAKYDNTQSTWLKETINSPKYELSFVMAESEVTQVAQNYTKKKVHLFKCQKNTKQIAMDFIL